ncbi:MAG: Pyruvate:Oxaloacetate transcarboxylase domain protein [uncultured Cytophagales bacterium]|uniref:Pyruvate:Oxaloacetate transcarboxylase domain protein n=1 Tax=uncultured Cytophagales bacterium TaxID=158755 RepID=A0A6J4I636_9SPHI|nr:MAG: Pyruvate:Oxaloacetate transcarboxylase domain protein [uncultured Cytophagales bacterium]
MQHVHLFETTPRDGLQNEKFILSTEQKLQLVRGLTECGFRKIEVGSFVNPKAVPQMAGTGELFGSLPAVPGVNYYGLIPNRKGYELALAAGCRHMGYVLAVTETMNQRNVRMPVAESFAQLEEIREQARRDGVRLRAYLAVVFHCPFEGPTDLARALEWVRKMADLGVEDICLADTDGNAAPERTALLLDAVRPMLDRMGYPGILSLHLHNTYGYADRNARLALERGIRHFDAATAGLGGCPFVPGAKGNIPTEALVQLCHEEGYATGIDQEKLAGLSRWLVALKEQKLAVGNSR